MTKINYVFSALAGMAMSTHALATASNPNHTGFYLGINGGYEIDKTKVKSSTNGVYDYVDDTNLAPNEHIAKDYSKSNSFKAKGFTGGTYLGYQHQVRRMVVGGEISFSFFESKEPTKNNYVDHFNIDGEDIKFYDQTRIRDKYNYGAAIKLGYLMSPTVVAGIKLGYLRDVYNVESKQTTLNGTDNQDFSKKTKKIKVNSLVPGVYVEKLFNNHWLVGGEYNYSISKKKKISLTGNEHLDDGDDHYNLNAANTKILKPSAHTIKIRLGYKF